MVLDFLYKYRKDYLASQNGEEGIILECLERLYFHVNKGHAVEIGGHTGRYCSNIASLLLNRGWSGLFVETDYSLYQRCVENWKINPRVRCQCSHVDGRNINAFVKDDCDLLSLDTDGGDYEIFRGLQARPKIVIVEIDSSISPTQWGFNADGGAGYREMVNEAQARDYFLLAHTGNLILLRNKYRDLFPEIVGDPLVDVDKYFNPAWLRAA